MAPRKRWPVLSCSCSRVASLAALASALAGGCRDRDCGPLPALCDEGRWLDLATVVLAAVSVDLDGDGALEAAALTFGGRQLAVGDRDGWRSMLLLDGTPIAMAALDRELAVAFVDEPRAAIFGRDGDGRLAWRRDIALTRPPSSLASGDLDGDGRPELVAVLPQSGKVAVIDPRTGAAREYFAGGSPFRLALGDVDGDAHLDVVAFDRAGQALQVLRNAGGGRLRSAQASAAYAELDALTLADHDGDGDLDVISRDPESAVYVQRNDGAGEFSSPIALPFLAGAASGRGLAAGPLAGGGLASVSVPWGGALGTWFGKGAAWLGHVEETFTKDVMWVGEGTDSGLLAGGEGFVTPFAYARGVAPIEVWREPGVRGGWGETAVAAGDLDGDHLLDVVAATPGQVTALHGRADLGLTPATAFASEGPTLALAIAELTGDARPDVLVAGEQSVMVAVGTEAGPFPLSSGDATLVRPRVLTPLRTGPNAPEVVVAVTASDADYEPEFAPAAVLRFDAEGRLIEERALGEGLGVGRVIAVDLDADGVDEPLLLAAREGAPVLVHATPDGQGYALGAELDVASLSGLPAEEVVLTRMAAGDLDDDGAAEVVLAGGSSAIVVSGLADGAPSATVLPEIAGPTHLRDIDGDGRLDGVFLVDGWRFSYHRGRGDGGFDGERPSFDLPYDSVSALAAPGAQFDLVTLGEDGLKVELAREVARPVVAGDAFDFHGEVSELVAADVNQDGFDDLVTVCRQWGGGVAVLWGDEEATLARADGYNDSGNNRGLAVGDLDGDGVAEVVVATGISSIEPLRFWPERVAKWFYIDSLFTLEQVEDLAIADLDDDGLPDLLAIAYIGDYGDLDQMTLYVAYGTEPLQFTEWTQVAAAPKLEKGALAIGDVDGDGDLDLLIRPAGAQPGLLVRATGPREWAEGEPTPGTTALFSPRDADGRVDLISHEDTTIYRHVDGDLERREALVRHPSLVAGALRQVGDADGDGRYDLVVRDDEATYVWLLGDDGPARVRIADKKLAAVQFPDLDGDGRPDIVGIGGDGQIFVRRSRR